MTKVRQARRAQAARKVLVERIAIAVVTLVSIPCVGMVLFAAGAVLSIN